MMIFEGIKQMRKRIVVLTTILLGAALFCVGVFFVYWEIWNCLFGSPVPGKGLGILMIVFGATLIVLGVLVVVKLFGL